MKEDNEINIESEINKILTQLAENFNNQEVREVKEFLNAGEYGVALETICFIILEENKKVGKKIYDQIVNIGMSMDLDSELWEDINSQVIL